MGTYKAERNREIYELYMREENRMTIPQLARNYNLNESRIRAIIKVESTKISIDRKVKEILQRKPELMFVETLLNYRQKQEFIEMYEN